MAPKSIYSDEMKARARQLRGEGLTFRQVGELLGVDRKVANHLVTVRLERGKRNMLAEEVKDQIRAMAAAGDLSHCEIGRRLGVHHGTVSRIAGPAASGMALAEIKRRIAQDMAAGDKTIHALAAEYGVSRETARKVWAEVGGGKPREKVSKISPETVEKVVALWRQKITYAEIAKACGIVVASVGRVLARQAKLDPTVTVGRRLIYGSKEERVSAYLARRRDKYQAERAAAGPAPARVPRPRPVAPPKPVAPMRVVYEAPKLDRKAELAAIEAAIADGKGIRYERAMTGSTKTASAIHDIHSAAAWLQEQGCRVTRQRGKGSHKSYQVTRDGVRLTARTWLEASEVTQLARTMASGVSFRAVPIRDAAPPAPAAQPEPGMIQYHRAAVLEMRPAGG